MRKLNGNICYRCLNARSKRKNIQVKGYHYKDRISFAYLHNSKKNQRLTDKQNDLDDVNNFCGRDGISINKTQTYIKRETSFSICWFSHSHHVTQCHRIYQRTILRILLMQLQAIAWHHAFYVINLCHSIWWVRNSITNLYLGEFHDQSLIFECEWVLTSQCIPIFIVNGNCSSFFSCSFKLNKSMSSLFWKKELLLKSTTLDYGRAKTPPCYK